MTINISRNVSSAFEAGYVNVRITRRWVGEIETAAEFSLKSEVIEGSENNIGNNVLRNIICFTRSNPRFLLLVMFQEIRRVLREIINASHYSSYGTNGSSKIMDKWIPLVSSTTHKNLIYKWR